jgi:RNA polymerase sigma factor (sigma-70 family)
VTVEDASASPLTVASPRPVGADPHDFAGLYIRHRASFTAHARRYLRDQRDADEVVQEAFLRLFLALPELDTELQALAYCRRTITNLCIDRYRAQARRPYLVDLDTAHVEDLADDDPGDPVVRAEDAALVRSALSMLSPLQRAALVKREVEDKSLPVIAGELDIPEDNVKHLLFRARRALRRLLAGSSLAPGGDAEAHGLGLSAKAGTRSLATLLVLLVLGLGSGPNLESIPVVGRDLPDVIGVTEVAETLRGVVAEVGEKIAPSGGAGTSAVGAGRLGSALLALSEQIADASEVVSADRAQTAGSTSQVSGPAGMPTLLAVLMPGSAQPSRVDALPPAAVPPSITASDAAASRAGNASSGGLDVLTAGTRPGGSEAGSPPTPGTAGPTTTPGAAAPSTTTPSSGAAAPVAADPQPPTSTDPPPRQTQPKAKADKAVKAEKGTSAKAPKPDKAKPSKASKPDKAVLKPKPKPAPAPAEPVVAEAPAAEPVATEPVATEPAATEAVVAEPPAAPSV